MSIDIGTCGLESYPVALMNSVDDHDFYSIMGRFFCDKSVLDELEGPIYNHVGSEWLVVKQNSDSVVAFSSFRPVQNGRWMFGDTWVAPSVRRSGIFGHLFSLRESICIQRGAKELRGLANVLSRPIYERNWYSVTFRRGPRWTGFVKTVGEVRHG